MPHKSKSNPSSWAVSSKKTGRGRPRKFIDPESYAPFEKIEIEKRGTSSGKNLDNQENRLVQTEKKAENKRMFPATSDRNYTTDEVEFMNALSEFKRNSGRTFPTCSEILGILRGLGYEKAAL